ncbi:carboxylesterase/lipase family protein [Actinocorallia sp. A-T 12471]|uniref:carboxylesterase/lipase family protein n=1 Tax=Actinocorallia sp. A-T 12471 TaxID=3089813 RepID=UPI0029D057FF|nr:carboxylesterase family protein [Actinocorallia sp. A-T 12471]MDX6741674.1 carboxylesterase family protein [Actinocorallia sp. A-T 12471]
MRKILRARRALLTAAAVVAAAVALPAAPASALPGSIVPTQAGLVQGTSPDAKGVRAYKGIPYAAAPVGNLRWKAPQAPSPWLGVRQATSFGNACYGVPQPSPVAMSEDCLTVNVWAPSGVLPKAVLVWPSGAGFQTGSSAQSVFDGAALAAEGVVVVTFNYRLGVFGFLARQDLDQESGSSGAWGLRDQIAALSWVKTNIGAFGGNPNKVTLFGASAGAHSVGMLMASPRTNGLFSKAIAESGAYWDSAHGSLPTHAQAVSRGQALSAQLNAPNLAALRAIPADTLNLATMWNPMTDPLLTAFAPSIDGYVLTKAPAQVFKDGDQRKIPLLAGYNGAENFPLFDLQVLPHGTPAEFYAAAEELFGADRMAEFQQLYPAADNAQAAESAFALLADMTISQQTWEMLDNHQRTTSAAAYGYKFTYTSPYSPVAAHVAEIPFVFGNLDEPQYFSPFSPPATAADRSFSAKVRDYWVNFAETGNPNGSGLPSWPQYTGPGSSLLELKSAPSTIADPDAARFQFLSSFRTDGRFPASWANS